MKFQTLGLMVIAGFVLVTSGRGIRAEDAPSVGKQQPASFEGEVLVKVSHEYLLYLPKEYDKQPSWPLVLFLHGSGESGRDINRVKANGLPKLIDQGKEFPFIVISPQSQRRGWMPAALNALIDDVTQKYHVDKDRIYVTGLSMGGSGTWSVAGAYPDKFAAIAPICGRGDLNDAPSLKNLAIWGFHGAKDEAVSVKYSQDMVNALKEAGSTSVNLTIYPELNHDSWTTTYDNPELYEWLLKQRRHQP